VTGEKHVGAVEVTEVTCPAWCTEPQSEHLADLPAWDGRVLHRSAEQAGDGWEVQHGSYTFVDGSPADGEHPSVRVTVTSETLHVDEARALGLAVLQACRQAES
jgi:hypothetical protein